jgi:hypothetical protein
MVPTTTAIVTTRLPDVMQAVIPPRKDAVIGSMAIAMRRLILEMRTSRYIRSMA